MVQARGASLEGPKPLQMNPVPRKSQSLALGLSLSNLGHRLPRSGAANILSKLGSIFVLKSQDGTADDT